MTGTPGLPGKGDSGFWAILASKVATPASPAVILAGLAWVGVDANFGASKDDTVQLAWLGAALLLSLLAVFLGYRFLLQPSSLQGPPPPAVPGGGGGHPELPSGPKVEDYRQQIQAAERGR